MLELNLKFLDPQHFTVSLINDNDREETKLLEFTSPVSNKGQQHLRWYSEKYVTQCGADIDSDTAQKIVKQLPILGKSLFNKVFSKKVAYHLFKKFKEIQAQDRLLTITADHPAILSLPWELLHSPNRGGHFLLDEKPSFSIRRRMQGTGNQLFTINPKNQLHILFIVSHHADDATNSRTDAQAILKGLDKYLAGRVTLEFLRPPTLNNLQKRLENQALAHVDIVHFNGCSQFDEMGNLENEAKMAFNFLSDALKREANSIEMGKNTGYLCFENDNGNSHLVPAQLFANLLNRHQVPLLILSAHHGTDEKPNHKDSLIAQLAATGIPFVLAMRYSMLTPATQKLFKAFYENLVPGQKIGTALDRARLALYQDTARREIPRFKERVTIHLQDWFFPVLYQQTPDSALLIPSDSEYSENTWFLQNDLPTPPAAGFFGRCHELLNIERQFVRGTRRITINGAEGQGKTQLAQEAGRWLHHTGLFKCVVFIDFANYQGVDPVSLAVSMIASVLQKQLLNAEAVTQALRRVPTLLIFDNLDALVEPGTPLSNGGTVPASLTGIGTQTMDSSPFNPGFNPGTTAEISPAFQTGTESTDSLDSFVFNNGEKNSPSLQTGTGATDPLLLNLNDGESGQNLQTGTTDSLNSLLSNKVDRIVGASQTGNKSPGGSILFNEERLGGIAGAAPQTETTGSILFNKERLGGIAGPQTENTGSSPILNPQSPIPNPQFQNPNEPNRNEVSKKPTGIAQLLDIAKKWSEIGQSRLIIITRRAQHHAGFPNMGSLKHHQFSLENLDKKGALCYFDALMQLPPAPVFGVPKQEEIEKLLEQVYYHPLSIKLLAGRLKNDSISTLNERLKSLLATLPTNNSSPNEKALVASFHLVLEKLEPYKPWLSKMGAFQDGAFENVLQSITDIPKAQWESLQQDLESSALIQPENLEGVTVAYLHIQPRLAHKLWAQLSPVDQQALTARYCQGYYELARFLYDEGNNNPHQTRAIERKELPNLLRAVHLALKSGTNWRMDFANYVNSFLNDFGIKSDLKKLTTKAKKTVPPGDFKNWFMSRSNQGEQLYAANRYQEAQAVFEEILEQLDETPSYHRCVTMGWLGRCLAEQGQFELSADYLRQTVSDLGQIESSQKVRLEMGRMQTYLATVLKEIKDYNGAREAYEIALAIVKEIQDTRNEAVIQSQLGTLGKLQGYPAEAEQRYHYALPLFKQLNDLKSEANVWHQLGDVYQERQQWEPAAQAYLQAANIREKQADLTGAIATWNQLAKVNRALGNLQEAERWYRKAIEGGKSKADWINVSEGFRNLAELLQLQPQRLVEAFTLAEAALSIDKTLNPNEAEIWRTYTLLAKIAEQQNNTLQAQDFRSLARRSKINTTGSQAELQQHQQLIEAVVQTVAQPKLRSQLDLMLQQREGKGWSSLVAAIRQILKGERDWDKLCDHECLDSTDAVIIQKILQELLS